MRYFYRKIAKNSHSAGGSAPRPPAFGGWEHTANGLRRLEASPQISIINPIANFWLLHMTPTELHQIQFT